MCLFSAPIFDPDARASTRMFEETRLSRVFLCLRTAIGIQRRCERVTGIRNGSTLSARADALPIPSSAPLLESPALTFLRGIE